MTQTSTTPQADTTTAMADDGTKTTLNFDMFATGIVTGVVVTTIVETGKGAVGLLARNPLLVLGSGIMAGYFAHKYRKEIIVSSHKVAEQSKEFVARQKKSFAELLGEAEKS